MPAPAPPQLPLPGAWVRRGTSLNETLRRIAQSRRRKGQCAATTGICMHGRIEKPAGPQDAERGTGGGRQCTSPPSGASMAGAPARGSWAVPSSCARCGPCGDTTRALARELDEPIAPAQIKSAESRVRMNRRRMDTWTDVHTSNWMAERGQRATGVRIGERDWATRGQGRKEEETRALCWRGGGDREAATTRKTGQRKKTSERGAAVGASEEQTHHVGVGARVREGVHTCTTTRFALSSPPYRSSVARPHPSRFALPHLRALTSSLLTPAAERSPSAAKTPVTPSFLKARGSAHTWWR